MSNPAEALAMNLTSRNALAQLTQDVFRLVTNLQRRSSLGRIRLLRLSIPVLWAAFPAPSNAQPLKLDSLSGWREVGWGFNSNGWNWSVGQGDTLVEQTINGPGTAYYHDSIYGSYVIEGTWRVSSASGDDDNMGFIFGYQDRFHFYLFDWKMAAQNSVGHEGPSTPPFHMPEGFVLKVLAAEAPDTFVNQDMGTAVDTLNATILHVDTGDGRGWAYNTPYYYTLDFRPGRINISVRDLHSELINFTVLDSTYLNGRFGFFNRSQSHVTYSGFRRSLVSDCDLSTTDECLVLCPAGDALFRATLRDEQGNTIPETQNVWLDLSGCDALVPCSSMTEWPIVRPLALADSLGRAVFSVRAGGCDTGCMVDVVTSCGVIASVPTRSLDGSGDLAVQLADYDTSACVDLDCSGALDGTDLSLFASHIGHRCASDLCDVLGDDLTLLPDTGLVPGQTIDLIARAVNSTSQPCRVDSVVFYVDSSFDVGTNMFHVGTSVGPDSLLPGASLQYVLPYTADSAMVQPTTCFSAVVFASCCPTGAIIENCVNRYVYKCPPDTVFEFTAFDVPNDSIYYLPVISQLPAGFDVNLDPPGATTLFSVTTVSASIHIDPHSVQLLGDQASVLMLFCSDSTCATLLAEREFTAIYAVQRGDVNNSCTVNSADIILLVNHIFKSGPPPVPQDAGDINCDGVISSADIIALVNFVFKGGATPLGKCP